MNETSAIEIRPACVGDVPTVLRLIKRLADYEHLSHEVVATEASLTEALFGERPSAEAVIAQSGGEAAGFALFFHNFSTFLGVRGLYLEDLFVLPAYRGQGIGKTLLRYLARLALERGCGRFEWTVLDWNKQARDFYESLGAQAVPSWVIYRVKDEALRKLAAESY